MLPRIESRLIHDLSPAISPRQRGFSRHFRECRIHWEPKLTNPKRKRGITGNREIPLLTLRVTVFVAATESWRRAGLVRNRLGGMMRPVADLVPRPTGITSNRPGLEMFSASSSRRYAEY